MVATITQLSAGNALQIVLQPPKGCRRWRVLRSTASVIPAFDHAGAVLVHDGNDRSVVDTDGLVNGTTYWYRAFYFVAGSWQATPAASAVAATTLINATNDHLEFLRDRIELGMAALIARGDFTPEAGYVPVLASSPELEKVAFPCITVHLASDADAVRGVGEEFAPDSEGDDGLIEYEGWLSALQFTVMVWSLNADQRKKVRQLLKAVLMANLPVFDSIGMVQVSMSFSDQEDFQSFPAPMYQAVCTLNAQAPSLVARPVPVVVDVEVTARDYERVTTTV